MREGPPEVTQVGEDLRPEAARAVFRIRRESGERQPRLFQEASRRDPADLCVRLQVDELARMPERHATPLQKSYHLGKLFVPSKHHAHRYWDRDPTPVSFGRLVA